MAPLLDWQSEVLVTHDAFDASRTRETGKFEMTTRIGAFRWLLKKASRSVVANGSHFINTAVTRRDDRQVVRALTYHRFGESYRDPFCISQAAFRAQMRQLARSGLVISLCQLQSFLAGQGHLPSNAVLVTVDDGFKSLHSIALPVLREYRIPAVAFVSAGLIASNQAGRIRSSDPEEYLEWDELAELHDAGVAIQSHGWSHRSLGYLKRDELMNELTLSKARLERRLAASVTAFAYPFGTRADYNGKVAAAAADAGYQVAFTSQHGGIQPGDDPFTLSRIKVESGETMKTFTSLVHGGLDAWRWVDRGLWRVQASRRGNA
jgi:peptidoglycan/xylan/chitin deacetylase (PgdA/CDA1 family)